MILADIQDLLPELANQVGRLMLSRVADYLYFEAGQMHSSRGEWAAKMDAAALVATVRSREF